LIFLLKILHPFPCTRTRATLLAGIITHGHIYEHKCNWTWFVITYKPSVHLVHPHITWTDGTQVWCYSLWITRICYLDRKRRNRDNLSFSPVPLRWIQTLQSPHRHMHSQLESARPNGGHGFKVVVRVCDSHHPSFLSPLYSLHVAHTHVKTVSFHILLMQ
jgi:hypothetical protein